MANTVMTIQPTRVKRRNGKGFVMYGRQSSGKWFERWFPTPAAAKAHAKKKGWHTALPLHTA
jgi:hypothetical protein